MSGIEYSAPEGAQTPSGRLVSRRSYGTGSLRVKHGSWYGSWRTGDGVRTSRKLGPVATMTEEQANERLQRLINSRSVYRERAGRERFDLNAGIYFITGGGMVKIGRTERLPVADRLERIQRSSPVPLILHRFIAIPLPDAVEEALHRRFADWRSHGEWFDGAVLEVADAWSDEEIIAMGAVRRLPTQTALRLQPSQKKVLAALSTDWQRVGFTAALARRTSKDIGPVLKALKARGLVEYDRRKGWRLADSEGTGRC